MKKQFESKFEQAFVRLVNNTPGVSQITVRTPQDAVAVVAEEISDYDREVVAVICLNARGNPVNFSVCSMGGMHKCQVWPAEILKVAILSNAPNILLVHNHPSGDVTPSIDDVALTDRMAQACQIMGVTLLDHIVIGHGCDKYYSLKERGELPMIEEKYTMDIDNISWKVAEEGGEAYV